jgi:hypothetical protein
MNAKLQKLKQKLRDMTEKIQSECDHKNKTMEYKSDTGNYDPSQDAYWINHVCPDCEKRWTTPQR